MEILENDDIGSLARECFDEQPPRAKDLLAIHVGRAFMPQRRHYMASQPARVIPPISGLHEAGNNALSARLRAQQVAQKALQGQVCHRLPIRPTTGCGYMKILCRVQSREKLFEQPRLARSGRRKDRDKLRTLLL